MKIGVVIPANDEQGSVGQIVQRCRESSDPFGSCRIVVCDNNSSDATASVARAAGAEVVFARQRGYGNACLSAIAHLGAWPDVLVFMDADGSSRPEEMGSLLRPILDEGVELVLGSRPPDSSMTLPQRWGNGLATRLISWRWGHTFSDLGPFRAIRYASYGRLGMQDRTWGWTVEMQILAVLSGLRIQEVSVSWDERMAGVSKISGTISGVVRAGAKILSTIARLSLRSPKVFQEQASPLRGAATRNL
jgi:hypothetical protein